MDIHEHRKPDYAVAPFFYERWSPRAFTAENISEETLRQIFEAARWAPSCFNEQPWQFIYALRGSENWPAFVGLLVEANQLWAKNAAVLIACISKKTFARNSRVNRTHSFDAGAAWLSLALEAHLLGWAAHGMAGVDLEKARQVFALPEDCEFEIMIAVGKPGKPETLPENLRDKEWPPSTRKKVSAFVTKR